jgi:hypothetical protein
MNWNIAVGSLASIFLLTTFLSIFRSKARSSDHPIEGYLLAGASLGRPSVISLLMSSSFALNSLFYALWLGYSIGAWAILIQAAWSLSFALLAPYAPAIHKHRSLHELLGSRFDTATRVVAGICSLVGMMYLMGWEVGISKSTLSGLLSFDSTMSVAQANAGSAWLTSGIVLGCLLYTVLGGLRGNAVADKFLNVAKILIVLVLTCFVIYRLHHATNLSLWAGLFPSFEAAMTNMGIWGFVTNIAFNVTWQFVDTSSWQSIIAGEQESESDTIGNLKWSGLSIFIAPGLLGTLLGAALVGTSGVSSDNVISIIATLVPPFDGLSLFLIVALVSACVMSLLDGLFLASAYTLVIDIFHPSSTLAQVESDPEKSERILLAVRTSLILLAIASSWGVSLLLEVLNLSLFQFVYVVIITQLALIGPILVGITTTRIARLPLWLSITISLIVGFGSVLFGAVHQLQWMVDGAGTFTIASSILFAFLSTKVSPASVRA